MAETVKFSEKDAITATEVSDVDRIPVVRMGGETKAIKMLPVSEAKSLFPGTGVGGTVDPADYVPTASTGTAEEINAIRDAMIAAGLMSPPDAPTASGGLADLTLTVDEAMTPVDVSGDFTGYDMTFAVAPSSDALVSGLALSSAGVLSGTPTAAAAGASIVVRGTNAGGTADSAFTLTVEAEAYPSAPPSDGLIADWRFSEGSGTTVADEVGSYDIDLTDAVTPNITWETHGVTGTNGGIMTPSLTDVRTIVQLYRVGNGDTTAYHNCGPGNDYSGATGADLNLDVSADTNWIGQGYGIHEVESYAPNGTFAYTMRTGGWRVLIREVPVAKTGLMAICSRLYNDQFRWPSFDLAWTACYDKALSESEREEVYNFARGLAVDRGFYIDVRDCPTRADFVFIAGQSNATGTAAIADLDTADQTRVYAKTKFYDGENAVNVPGDFVTMVMGETSTYSASAFGPEVTIANLREDTPGARDLYILKQSQVSVGIDQWTFIPDRTKNGWRRIADMFHYQNAILLDDGIGMDFKGFVWFQGEHDMSNTTDADTYETELGTLIDEFRGNIPYDDLPVVIARPYLASPTDATAYATVRTAIADVAAARTGVTVIDTDSMSRSDGTHLNADGYEDLADDVAAVLW